MIDSEIDSNVADGSRSVILDQVSYGIAVRMAVMTMALGRENMGREDTGHNETDAPDNQRGQK